MIQPPKPESQLIDLPEFFGILRRRSWIVILTTVLVALSALGLVFIRTPVYTSRAEVEVQPSTSDEQAQDINMETEATRVTQEQIATLAAPAMGLNAGSSLQLAKAAENVQVDVPTGTTFLDISCSASSSSRAQTCAAAFAEAYVTDRVEGASDRYQVAMDAVTNNIRLANRQLEELESQSADSAAEREDLQTRIDRQNQIILAAQALAFALPSPNPTAAQVSRSADLPDLPANKAYALTLVLATLLGLVLGLGLAFVRDRLDERIRDRAGLEGALAAPVLATIPYVKAWRDKKDTMLITRDAPGSPAAEAYKSARPTFLYLTQRRSVKVVAVTGPGAGEGKTTTTANLAVALAQAGQRVAVISCDLRLPRLHLFLGRDNETGLSDILTAKVAWIDALQATDIDGLSLIASGPAPDNPSELLGNDEMKDLLADLRKEFDLILLDTAPALSSADTITIIPETDGVVAVADASKTRRGDVTQLLHLVERVGGHVIGGVLNNLGAHAGLNTSYGRSTYSAGHESEGVEDVVKAGATEDAPIVDGAGRPSRKSTRSVNSNLGERDKAL